MNQSELEKHYFIAYARKDRDIAMQLKVDLEKHGFVIWIDEDNIVGGDEWEEKIVKNIRCSKAVLYLVSPMSYDSNPVKHELGYAKTYKKRTIPIWIRGNAEWSITVVYGFYHLNYIDMRGDLYWAGIDKLIGTLKHLSDSDPRYTRYLQEEGNNDSQNIDEATAYSANNEILRINKSNQNNQLSDKEEAMPETVGRFNWLLAAKKWLRNFSPQLVHQPKVNAMPTTSIPSYQPINDLRNPYKGLFAFEYKDAADFFGREDLIRDMLKQVKDILKDGKGYSRASRCMMVVGASGSGKSSVAMAGLLPALEDKQNIPEIKRWFFLEPIRPGERPIKAIVQTLKLPFLNKVQVGHSPLEKWNRDDLEQKLNEPDAYGLNDLLREISTSPDDRIVIVIDQFEEIFAPTISSDQRDLFINLLMAIASEPDIPVLLIFTLRADFYDRILDNGDLYKKIQGHKIDIPPMTREELRAVIEKPAHCVNVTFDSYLAEDLLYEVIKRPESLPLLQFTLDQLFKHRDGKQLTRQSYDDKIGGLKGAIDKHAEDVYENLATPALRLEYQDEARKLFTEHFIHITESNDEPSRLETGEEITRRRVTQAELGLNKSKIRVEVINAFVDARLLTATSRATKSTRLEYSESDTTYEISHEALINAWKRFRDWIKEDRKDIYLIQSLRPRVKQWDQERDRDKKKSLLAEKAVLQQLREYQQRKTLESRTIEYFQASLARQKRQKTNRYVLSIGVTALVIFALVVGSILKNILSPSPLDPTIVTSLASSGPGTLMYVLQMARPNATITFDSSLQGKTISLSNLDIDNSLTIQGPSNHTIKIISNMTGNHIHIEPGRNVTIENLVFTNSYTLGNSLIENDGNLTINNCYLFGNKSYSSGGVIANTGDLTLNDDRIINNATSSNGGAIYNVAGTININGNNIIDSNEAYSNGGGIYSQGGSVIVNGGTISNNNADSNAGGGIAIINGLLSIDGVHIESNHANYTKNDINGGVGGGIAIEGSVALINSSVITLNTATQSGGGIVVMADPDNGSTSQVKLRNTNSKESQNAIYYLDSNTVNNSLNNIAGIFEGTDPNLQILDDPTIDNLGSPPASHPVQKSLNYLGIANITDFCLAHAGSSGQVSTHVDHQAKDIMVTCLNRNNNPVGTDFSGQAICQFQYTAHAGINSVIDHMANYHDPTSLQCYKNLKLLGPIGQTGFAKYCASQPDYTGLFDNPKGRQTAYDWLCQNKDKSRLPIGLSVADACALQYGKTDAIDRLANFNTPDGWECWDPAS